MDTLKLKKMPRLACAKSKKQDRRIKEECVEKAWDVIRQVATDLNLRPGQVRRRYRKGDDVVMVAVEAHTRIAATAVCSSFEFIPRGPDWEEIFQTIMEIIKMLLPFLIMLF